MMCITYPPGKHYVMFSTTLSTSFYLENVHTFSLVFLFVLPQNIVGYNQLIYSNFQAIVPDNSNDIVTSFVLFYSSIGENINRPLLVLLCNQ